MKRWHWFVVAVVLGTLATWPLAAAEPQAGTPVVAEKVRQLMQDRNYPASIQAIDEALQAQSGPADYLAYLKGWALCLAKQYDPAIAALEQMEKQYPQSPWVRRARFARGVAMARKGDFHGAELIYRAEAGALLSVDRKGELADLCLGYADTYFRPLKPDEKPDYRLALEFYEKALEVGPKPDKRAEVQLRVAECYQQLKDWDEAAQRYAQFSQDHPKGPLDIEARYRLGECRLANGNPKEARRAWQDLLATYPDSPSARIAEAQFNLAKTWGMPHAESQAELNLGVAALEAFLERFPDHKLAGEAFLSMAAGYSRHERHDDAARVLGRFLQDPRYQACKEIPEARWLLGKAYQMEKKYAQALSAWHEYLGQHSSDQRWSTVQQEVVNTEYLMGLEKYEATQFDEASRLWTEFLARYPLDRRNAEILFRFGSMNHQQKKWEAAIADWRRVVSKYADTDWASESQWMIARTLEDQLGQHEKAIEEYRKVRTGSRAPEAAQAIARLEAKSMTIVTDRVFRSDEVPKIRLTTRNLESVTVRVYQVDLETYFRKMHQAQNIKPLSIALIDPDRTFEFKVPAYAKYQQFENDVEVPLPGGLRSGVLAVTVSSKNLEATTLVLQSDLDLVVKTSRQEIFVFAENMRTGKPWPGARLLISNGSQIFAEVATGPDGVFQRSFDELKDVPDVRVFGSSEQHVSSTMLGLAGLNVARGLSDKGYLYTDRPAYQPGQVVHVRGCVRQVANDAYMVVQDKPYTLHVADGRGREIWKENVKPGAFGSFHAEFTLPTTSAQGSYRILAQNTEGRSYQGAFQVHQYTVDPVQLTIDSPRRVYYRGEQVEGTIRAAYSYGAPLAGRNVTYRLADDRLYRAKTDDKGEAHFKLPTREFLETQVLPLEVALPDENLATAVNFRLAQQGFLIELSTPRLVFLAGETFEVTAKVRDAEGKPLAQKLALKVLEQTNVEGKVGQRPVEEHELQTGTADGTVRKILKLEKGGTYVLRAEGMDRFKNPISEQLNVQISGEEDQTRLRILADQHTYRVGDTAKIRVHWRGQPALALMTSQGARVLGYQLVELKRGDNELAIPMGAALAPNFELSVVVMTDGRAEAAPPATPVKPNTPAQPAPGGRPPVVRFHHVSSPFTVERELKVHLSARRKDNAPGPIRPGEEVAVTVLTTDPQGKPVPAEVSLAMVQQSLLERFASPEPKIQDFFHGVAREPQVRTDSSITFAQHPRTSPINPRLLAEEDRQELAQSEETSRLAAVKRAGGGIGGGAAASAAPRTPVQAPAGAPANDNPFADSGSTPAPPQGVQSADSSQADAEQTGQPKVAVQSPKPARQQIAARPLPAISPLETGYWSPAVVTDKDGQAIVTFTMPEQSTVWTLVAKGITAETLAGETSEKLAVKKDLFGQLRLPLALTDGDEAEIGVTVHNDLVDKGSIEITLRTTIDNRVVEEKRTIEARSKGIEELGFKTKIGAGDNAAHSAVIFELIVAAGNRKDVVRQTIPLLPYGMPVFTAVSGSATGDTTVWVEPPKDMAVAGPNLQILIGPTVERSLLDIVSEPGPIASRSWEMVHPGTEVERATSDLMASLALQKLIAGSRDAGSPQAQALDSRIRGALANLVSSQSEDGGWSWTGQEGTSHGHTTARATWAISLARSAGYRVSDGTFEKALAYLRNQVTTAETGDLESRAIVLCALAVAGQGDFALANHLYRDRLNLSNTALAYLAMAFAEMDRKPTAGELLDLLAKRNLDAPTAAPPLSAGTPVAQPPSAGKSTPEGGRATDRWGSTVEIRALYALAIQRVTPQSPKAKELIDWLLAHRTGRRWVPEKATGPAALALGAWFTQNRFEGQRYRLAVAVNDAQVKVLDVDPAAGTLVVDVPRAQLKPDKQRVSFQMTGRGRYTYQCILGGFVPAGQLKSTTTDWTVQRTCEPAPLEFDGREIPRGFKVVQGPHTPFRNAVAQLPVGKRAVVELKVKRATAEFTPEGGRATAGDGRVKAEEGGVTTEPRLEYLVITEPIPSGASVIANSIRGGFDRFEIGPGAMTFYVGAHKSIKPICYEVHGYLPGTYRAAPTVIRNAYRPEQLAVFRPSTLGVLPRGTASTDPYRLTPDELYELGTRLLAKGEKKEAAGHLAELVEKWNLSAEVYQKTIQSLLEIHLDLGPADKVVHDFEIVKEKWPEQEISFDQIVKVGAAYDAIGEFERAYLVFRATVENSFLRDSGVAGFLDEGEEFLRSVELMERLLREHPPEPYVASAQVGLSQHVYAKAPEAASDYRLRAAKVNRVDLVRRAWGMLEAMLTEFPEDPAADQAAFSAANALLEIKDFVQAAAACSRYAQRYPKSQLLDSFWYVTGYGKFAAGEPQAALEMCRKVAEARLTDPATGRSKDSPNKWQAIYIMGQIYHSLGQAADAVREYRRVEDRFDDAEQSLDYFLHKSIELPEATTVKPGQPVEVELKFRNLTACDAKVYRVDLMKFGLLERNGGGIADINLAGIRPQFETAVKLGNDKDYRQRTHRLPLPLEKEGAYLVVCRGEDLHTSGLVLVTPLAVEVQADGQTGQVRAVIKDAVADRYLNNVQVRIIGSRSEEVVSGTTDLRGVFVADGIRGVPTVIAELPPGRYAFFRGQPGAQEMETTGPVVQRPQKKRQPQAPEVHVATVPTEPEQSPTASSTLPTGARVFGESEAEKRIRTVLNRLTDLNLTNAPLNQVVAALKESYKIEIQLDQKALDEVGLAPDLPVNIQVNGVRLKSALQLLLRQHDLTYMIRDDVLLITTPDRAAENLVRVVYPVGDLVLPGGTDDPATADFDSLIDMLTSTVTPTTWDSVGGSGSIQRFENSWSLVVSQTEETQEEIAQLLQTLRDIKPTQRLSLPARQPAPARAPRATGGGMMGGMGGMGTIRVRGEAKPSPRVPPEPSAAPPQQGSDRNTHLLDGLQKSNQGFQRQQVEQLKGMYKGGKGGVGAGAAF